MQFKPRTNHRIHANPFPRYSHKFKWTNTLGNKQAWLTKTPCRCPYAYGPNAQNHQATHMPPYVDSLIHEAILHTTTNPPTHDCTLYFQGTNYTSMPQHAPTLNSTNSNWYETEQSHLNYHADADTLFDTTNIHPQNNKTIMSISLGATRDFLIKHNRTKQVFRIPLRNGDVLIMYRDTQTHYKHALPPPPPPTSEESFREVLNGPTPWTKWKVLRIISSTLKFQKT